MTRVTRVVPQRSETVFAALSDPYTYPEWLVGARSIRHVEDGWPRVGTRFHHRVGLLGPLTVEDHSESLAVDVPDRLAMSVRARPLGSARVVFSLTPVPSAGGTWSTRIEFDEELIGFMRPLTPVLKPLIKLRNERSLDAFARYLNTTEPG